VRRHLPPHLTLDLFGGHAWIGIVPFAMTNVAPRGVPSVPLLSAFPELNVRTYVRVGDRPGIHFFSLDAGRAAAVQAARTLLNLPYHLARMRVTGRGDRIEYHSRRQTESDAAFSAVYGPAGQPFRAAVGSLEWFLTERYCLYHIDRRQRPYRLDIHHAPWRLQPATATLMRNTMAAVNGLTLPDSAPLLHFVKRQDTVAWLPTRI
jgi:uncharacterized protein YqjF (DUF2071 family)